MDVIISHPGQCCAGWCIEDIALHNGDREDIGHVAERLKVKLADAWDKGWDARQEAVLSYFGGAYRDPDYYPQANPYRPADD